MSSYNSGNSTVNKHSKPTFNCDPLLRKAAQLYSSSSPQSPTTEDGFQIDMSSNNSSSITEPLLHMGESSSASSNRSSSSLVNHNGKYAASQSSNSEYFKVISCDVKNATGDIPVQRQSHTAIAVNLPLTGQAMYVFGGYKGRRYYNDMYQFDVATRQWTHIPVVMKSLLDEVPRGRMWHSSVLLEKENKMIIFAGETDDEKDLCDMYEFDIIKQVWSQIKPFGNSVWPCTRSCHSTVLRKKINKHSNEEELSMVIFAGNNDGHKLNDMYEFSFKTRHWTRLSEGSKSKSKSKSYDADDKDEEELYPKARYNHSAVMQNTTDRMFIFGGKSGTARLNDLWCYDFQKRSWTELATRGHKPSPRSVHSCCMLPGDNQMLLFGGYNGNCKLNDMFCLDIPTLTWRRVTIFGQVPRPTSNLSMVVCAGGSSGNFYQQANSTSSFAPLSSAPSNKDDVKVILFGGYNGEHVVNDMYEMQILKIKDEDSCVIEQSPIEVIEEISKLYNQAANANILFLVQGKSFFCHKFIISRCRALTLLMEQNPSEVIVIKDVLIHCFEALLQFLYGIEPNLDYLNLVDIIYTAQQFGMEAMAKWCIAQVKAPNSKIITQSNVIYVLRDADERSLDELKTVCIKFLRGLNASQREKVFESDDCRLLSKSLLLELLKSSEAAIVQSATTSTNNNNSVQSTPVRTSASTAPQTQAYESLIQSLEASSSTDNAFKPTNNTVSSPARLLLSHLRGLFSHSNKNNNFSDLVIKSQNGDYEFHVHKVLLMCRSSYFSAMLSGAYHDSRQTQITMELLDGLALEKVLKYVYGVPILLQGDATNTSLTLHLMELLSISTMLLLQDLEHKCCAQLEMRIVPKHLKMLLQFEKIVHCSFLRSACEKEIRQLLSEEDMSEIVADHYYCNDPNDTK